jgi:hypothetical protein
MLLPRFQETYSHKTRLFVARSFCSQYRDSTVIKMLQLIDSEFKDIFKETQKLLSLILTISATSVTAERNFCCLKRIKTYLRNSMCQERLNELATLKRNC